MRHSRVRKAKLEPCQASMQTSSHCPETPQPYYLPVTLQNGSYQFNITVEPGKTYYLDPTAATGYIYKTNPGDPNFASVDSAYASIDAVPPLIYV